MESEQRGITKLTFPRAGVTGVTIFSSECQSAVGDHIAWRMAMYYVGTGPASSVLYMHLGVVKLFPGLLYTA